MLAAATLHRVFISYHHKNDQPFKEELVQLGEDHKIFSDWSVDTGDISEELDNQTIRRIIRDDYLRSSTVTILLVGMETRYRMHVDWELKSSMINGSVNKRSGILVINLPSVNCTYVTAPHDGEKSAVYPTYDNWVGGLSRAEYERRYPYMPARIIDNVRGPKAKISVTNWRTIIHDPEKLRFLVGATAEARLSCEYDLTLPMRRNNRGPEMSRLLVSGE